MRLLPPPGFDPNVFYHGVTLFQSWDIFPGSRTSGIKPVEATLEKLAFPERLDGMRVLDIGPWNGFFSFECVRRGAREVVSLAPEDPGATGYKNTAGLLQIENVRFVQESVYDIPKLQLGTFDIVLFLGVIYHLRHPLLGLDILHDVCSGLLFVDTPVIDSLGQVLLSPADRERITPVWPDTAGIPLVYFSQRDECARARDACNWFIPNQRALQNWITTAGFEIESFVGEGTWAFARARKALRNFEPGLEGFNAAAVAVKPKPAGCVVAQLDSDS